MLNLLLQAASGATQQGAGQQGNILMTIVPFVLIFVIFYFFLIRPQNKKQKETDRMLSALKKGDKIITIGGIHGTVTSVKEKTVIIRVDDNTKIEINRTAVSTVISDKPQEQAKVEEKKGFFDKFKKTEEKPADKPAKTEEDTEEKSEESDSKD